MNLMLNLRKYVPMVVVGKLLCFDSFFVWHPFLCKSNYLRFFSHTYSNDICVILQVSFSWLVLVPLLGFEFGSIAQGESCFVDISSID